MKNHISIKFLAVLLATLSLLAAVGSAAGIICLTSLNLYESSVDEVFAEETAAIRRNFAVHLVHRYASLELGNLPESYLNAYRGENWLYNTFRNDRYYFTIRNENGTIVDSTLPDSLPADAVCYEILVTDIRYRSVVAQVSPEPDPEATDPTETVPDSSSPTIPMAEETAVTSESALIVDGYYDTVTGTYQELHYQYADLPPYTVELYLMPGALPQEQAWSMLRELWQLRVELFYILGIGLLLFAAFMVFLCCTAGKKPGSEEARAGGLNRMPLDLYAAITGLVVFCILFAGWEVGEELFYYSPSLMGCFLFFAGFFLCLLPVSFCFACAAQFKTPGGYWWRGSILGRFTVLIIWLDKKLPSMLRKFIRTLWRWIRNILTLTRRAMLAVIGKINYACSWIGKRLARFYCLLPLTWQWILTGFVMMCLLFLAFTADSGGWLLIGLGLFFAIILYGASAFGILLQSAKRMRGGDLETKVSGQFLTGSFQEFAGELNGLADVAMVAAQKQLRSERMKTELITNVSHDIKTPLTSIINYVDLLEKPHTPEEEKAYLEVLSRQSQRLKKLVDDLMEMSKASTGNLSVDITRINAAEAINQALGEFSDKLEKAKLIPVFQQPEIPVYMLADGRLVWRVMSNLLSNAVKYALPGTRVYLDLTQESGRVFISLKNISREALNVSADELLERFVRGDTSRNTEGSGLGLNNAKSLMEVQKGQLELLVDGDLFKVTLTFPGVL